MKAVALLVLVVLGLAIASSAQDSIPPGTILPVELNSSLRSRTAKPGQTIHARLMQDVPLPSDSKIPAGAKVVGHVISVRVSSPSSTASITFRFDTVIAKNRRIPADTSLRAMASMLDVNEALIPDTGPDRGTSEASWVTNQIGGEVVYHGASVVNGSTVVGHPLLGGGVLVRISARPGTKCRGEAYGDDRPQALWVFSSDACGLYGYDNIILAHAGRSDPRGQITLESTGRDLNIRAGSGLLLRVNPA
jgi:hypothetical protein